MKYKKEFATIALIMLTEILGWSLVLPYLPFMAQDLGASALIVGLLLASFSFFQFLSAPIIGKLSDRFGRKPLLIISQVSTFVGFLILGFANNIWMLFLSRIVDGLFGSNMTLSRAYITDITNEKNRAKTFGKLGAIFGIGFFIGPALGGFLATINYSIPAFLAALMTLISIILTWTLLKETIKRKKNIKLKLDDFFPLKDFIKGLRNPDLKLVFTEYFFYITGFTILTSSLALLMGAQLGFGPGDVGLMLMFVGLTRIIFQLLALPRLLNRFTENVLTVAGLVITVISMMSIFFITNRILIYAIMVLFSIGSGLSRPLITTMISNKGDKKEMGKFMGVLDSIGSISQIIGPLIGGYMINNFYPGWLSILSGSLVVIAVLIEVVDLIKTKNKKIEVKV